MKFMIIDVDRYDVAESDKSIVEAGSPEAAYDKFIKQTYGEEHDNDTDERYRDLYPLMSTEAKGMWGWGEEEVTFIMIQI